jgi:hypothetical protein
VYIFQPIKPLEQLAYSECITKTVGSFLGFGGQQSTITIECANTQFYPKDQIALTLAIDNSHCDSAIKSIEFMLL